MGTGVVTVLKDTPTLSVQASPSVQVGNPISASATLAQGTAPTGTAEINLYGPSDPTCAGVPLATSNPTVGGNGTYGSSQFSAPTAGTYRFIAGYSGDANNNGVGPTSCGAAGSTVVVSKDSPTLSVQASSAQAGNPISASATLAAGTNPSGALEINLYGPSDPTCAGAPLATSSPAVSGNGTYNSNPFTTSIAGTYRFVATYSSDANNNGASTICGDAGATVEVTAPPPGPGPGPAPDTTAPETTITAIPKATLKSKAGKKEAKASFAFTSTEAGSSFECRLDAKPFATCTSPKALMAGKGKHTFEVVAIDAAGNRDGTPARAAFTVVLKKKRPKG